MNVLQHKIVIVFFLSMYTFCNTSSANQLIDSLETVLRKSSKEEKVDILNTLSGIYVLNKKTVEKARNYALEAEKLARGFVYNKGLANAIDNQGYVYQFKQDYTNAHERFIAALKLRTAEQDKTGEAASKNNIGRIFYLQEDYKTAEKQLEEALNLRKELGDKKGQAETYQNLGDIFIAEKRYYRYADENYTNALELQLQLGDMEKAAKISSQIGDLNFDMKHFDNAEVSYEHALGINRDRNDQANIAKNYNSLGNVNLAQSYTEEAVENYKNALSLRQQLKDTLGQAETLKNLGLTYLDAKKKRVAIDYFKQSSDLLFAFPAKKGTPTILKEIADAYKSMGETDLALENLTAYAQHREQVLNQEKINASIDLQTKYESQFQANELKTQNEVLQKEKRTNRLIRSFLLAILGLIGILALVLFNSNRRKKKANELLTAKNNEIENKNLEIQDKNNELDGLNRKLVNEMAERESIEQSSFARDRFLATMSHEMRTPMNIISGLTHLLLNENPRPDQVEHLRTLQFSANNLVVFINDVLDFSKIEAGKLSFDNIAFESKNVFGEIKERFSLAAKDKKLDFEIDYDEKLPLKLLGDPTRLNQVMTNLVSNAIKYTDKGSIKLDVSVHELFKDDITLLVSVEDTGRGIEQEKLDEMFKKFSRSSEDIFEGYGGSGLGLAITKRLVDLQNGKIEAKSTIGKGTSFKVYLPYKLVDKSKIEVAKVTKEEKKSTNYTHLEGHKILLVEDNKINQLVVAKMLKKLGVLVTTANNGQEALEAFNENYFDLVLMDIQMPIMDGYRATAEIRKSIDTRKRDVPIIALTASAFLTEKEKAKLFGMNDHVGKPFGPDDLLGKISHCLTTAKIE